MAELKSIARHQVPSVLSDCQPHLPLDNLGVGIKFVRVGGCFLVGRPIPHHHFIKAFFQIVGLELLKTDGSDHATPLCLLLQRGWNLIRPQE